MKKLTLGILLTLVLLTSSVYYLLGDDVKISIENTRTKYFVSENDNWVHAATEYTNIFDGTKKMRAKSRELTSWNDSEYAYTRRTSTWKDEIKTIQTYTFSKTSDDITQFPLKNEFQCLNCEGKIVHYEIRDIKYDGETKQINSPFSFGNNMKIEWQEGAYYSKVFQQKSSDKIIIKYRPKSPDETYNVRLFDPPMEMEKEPVEYNTTSTQINKTAFGGKQITQIEIDSEYPCYLQSSGEAICPIILPDKLLDLKAELKSEIKDIDIKDDKGDLITDKNKIDQEKDKLVDDKILKGIPITDYRKAKYKVNGTVNWTDEEGKEWTIDSLVQDGYETTYLDMNVEQIISADMILNGEICIGFDC